MCGVYSFGLLEYYLLCDTEKPGSVLVFFHDVIQTYSQFDLYNVSPQQKLSSHDILHVETV